MKPLRAIHVAPGRGWLTVSSSSADDLAELFVAVTGESTIEARQECAYPVRLAARPEDDEVSQAVTKAMRSTGLDDALDVPDGS